MSLYTIKEVAEALRLKRSVIDQSISREGFTTTPGKVMGRYGRAWTVQDAIRLQVFRAIPVLRSETRAQVIARVPFDDLSDRFLAITAFAGPVSITEWKTADGGILREVKVPDDTVVVATSADIPNLVQDRWSRKVTLISLENIERHVTETLMAIRSDDDGSSSAKGAPGAVLATHRRSASPPDRALIV